ASAFRSAAVTAAKIVPATGVRAASTYASILTKVLGQDVRVKPKAIPIEDVDDIFKHPTILPTVHNIPVCRVSFQSFQLHRLDFYMDFCRKAAQHMGIPCTGVIRLPRVTRRWTVLKSPFIHKSSMEVFERRTYKRVLVVRDADPEVVKKWIDYIDKNIPAGIGMKHRNIEYESLDYATQLEKNLQTRDPRKIGVEELRAVDRAQDVVKRGRRMLWTTYNNLPVYSKSDVAGMAQEVINQLKTNPKANIEEITRTIVMGTRPPVDKKPKKAKAAAAAAAAESSTPAKAKK
ncbi:mitochondrial 37S ribosomal protein rsm10, partial [Linderina macrospora]